MSADIATRDAHADDDFTMKVGNREFSGKGALEDVHLPTDIVLLVDVGRAG